MKSPEEYGTRVRCYRHVHACMVKDVSLLLSIAYDNEFLGQAGCANENAWKLGIKRTRLNRTLFSSDTRLETSNPTNGWIPRVKGTVRVHSWVSMAFIGSFEHVLFHNGYHSLQTVPGFECFIHSVEQLGCVHNSIYLIRCFSSKDQILDTRYRYERKPLYTDSLNIVKVYSRSINYSVGGNFKRIEY